MTEETKATPEPVPHVGRIKCTEASPPAAAQMSAAALLKDGYTVIVVTHDGQKAPPACIPCRPSDLGEVLITTMMVEMDMLRECKVIVVIDAQPIFHMVRAFHPIKPDVVDSIVREMCLAYPDDDLSGIYVYE